MAWFAAALVGFLVVVLLAGRTFFLSNVGLDRNPAVLEDKAQGSDRRDRARGASR